MHVNIAQWVERNALIYKEKPAVKDDVQTWSYRELEQRANQFAHGLESLSIAAGERVALLLPNCAEMVEILFGCAKAGASYVPLNWRLGEDELTYILRDCTPRVLVYESTWRERALALQKRVKTPLTLLEVERGDVTAQQDIQGLQSFLDAQSQERYTPVGGGDDDLMIIYTSGTTGNPKGVVLTHMNVFWQTINGWALGISPKNICLVLLPLFHVGGLNGSVTPVLHVGGTVLLQKKFDAETVLKTIETEGVDGILGVPTIYRILADHPYFKHCDLSGCEVLLSGGAPLPESLIELYHKRGLEFRQGYGLTEAAPGVTGMGPGECLRKSGSAGRSILYTEVQIVNERGETMPVGESGEIIVRGPNVMKGYWNLPEETARTIRNGWLHTGDVGRFDEDGFLYIVDRKKDMLISGGENVYPAEIEKLLAGHERVQMVTVVGQKDEKWGEIPVAVVVARDTELTEEELKQYLRDKLARYKQPKAYHFVDDLPLNASGKVIKADVRKRIGIEG